MKYFIVPFLLIVFSCKQNSRDTSSSTQVFEFDTLYLTAEQVKTEEDYEKSLVIVINTVPPETQLEVGKTDTMTVKIHRMENYPALIKNMVNCRLVRLDSSWFTITPDSINCSFEVWQDYDSGRVISRMKTPYGDSTRVTYKMLEGEHIVGKINMTKYVANKR